MPFPVKTFRMSFIWQGKTFWEYVQAWSSCEAIQMIQRRYPGASTVTWQEVG